LEKEKNEFDKDPSVDIIYGNYYIINEEGKIKFQFNYKNYDSNKELIAALVRENPIPDPGTMIKKECYEKYGNYNLKFLVSEDYELWVRWSRYCHFKHINTPVYMWRMHEDSLTLGKKKTISNKLHYKAEVLRKMLKMFTLRDLFPYPEWDNLTEDERYALSYNNIARIFITRNAFKDAIKYYKKSIEKIPNETAFFYMGIVLLKMEKIEEGIKCIKEAKKFNPYLFQNQENISLIQNLSDKAQNAVLKEI
jgi:tetratricopeptide (TPR) repeat protein